MKTHLYTFDKRSIASSKSENSSSQRNSVVALIAIVHLGELSWEVAQDQNAVSLLPVNHDHQKHITVIAS